MIRVHGTKVTANEAAKFLVFSLGDNAEYWQDDDSTNFECMTEKEVKAVNEAVEKQLYRVQEFLGAGKLCDKIFNRS